MGKELDEIWVLFLVIKENFHRNLASNSRFIIKNDLWSWMMLKSNVQKKLDIRLMNNPSPQHD